MSRWIRIAGLLPLLLATVAPSARAQSSNRIVELEIKFADAASDDHQQWAEALADVGADRVRLVSGEGSKPTANEAQFGGQTVITVTGILERGGALVLPNGKYSRQDTGKIRAWIAKLRADGAQVTLSQKMAFGLTAEQLVSVGDALAAKIEFDTKGQRIGDVVGKIQRQLSIPLKIDSAAQSKLNGPDSVAEEMNGLSVGTVLAAVIRPLGLVSAPSRPIGQSIEIAILDSRAADEHWPVGWPIQQSPAKSAPQLFERFNFELNKAPLSAALAAIEQKTKVPILSDHNSFARSGVDLSQIRVSYNKKRQTYFGTIDNLLSQARPRLKLELRVDEAQHPFLWISATQ